MTAAAVSAVTAMAAALGIGTMYGLAMRGLGRRRFESSTDWLTDCYLRHENSWVPGPVMFTVASYKGFQRKREPEMYYILLRPSPATGLICLLGLFAIFGSLALRDKGDAARAFNAQKEADLKRDLVEQRAAFARSCYLFGLKDGDNFVHQHPLASHPEKCSKEATDLRAKLGPPNANDRLELRRDIWKTVILNIQADVDYACKKNGWPAGYLPAHHGPDLYACFEQHPEPTLTTGWGASLSKS